MNVITERDMLRQVKRDWESRYGARDSDNDDSCAFNVRKMRRQIAAIDPETVTREELDAIGLKGWGALDCDECDKPQDAVIHFGMEPDYDARWWYVCRECLALAAQALPQPFPQETK